MQPHCLLNTHTRAYIPWRGVIFGPWWWPDLPAAASADRRSCGRGPAAPCTAPSAGGTDPAHSPACPAGVRSHAAGGQSKQLRLASLTECAQFSRWHSLKTASRGQHVSTVEGLSTVRSHLTSSHFLTIWAVYDQAFTADLRVYSFLSCHLLNQSHLENLSHSNHVALWPGGKQDKTVMAHLLWRLCTAVAFSALLTLHCR